ncbi:MAG TPA: Hsp20/alpha crystallin family protein [Polyangiaceae bacterium]|nr:Hsp20/alpha crystallin family protein [Polyangiaceae bacterium]
MLTLWNQFDDLFANEVRGVRRAPRGFDPAVDIEETSDGYLLTADVPGVKPEDVDVTVQDGVLTVKGERKSEKREEAEGYRRLERSFGSFQRAFVLPKGVNADGVTAEIEHGQLRVRVPKPVAALPKKVTVGGARTVVPEAKAS